MDFITHCIIPPPQVHWSPPDVGFLKLNFDGSYLCEMVWQAMVVSSVLMLALSYFHLLVQFLMVL